MIKKTNLQQDTLTNYKWENEILETLMNIVFLLQTSSMMLGKSGVNIYTKQCAMNPHIVGCEILQFNLLGNIYPHCTLGPFEFEYHKSTKGSYHISVASPSQTWRLRWLYKLKSMLGTFLTPST